MTSGLYEQLTEAGQLVAHVEVEMDTGDPQAHRVIQPALVPFISYPYEWSFSQLKDAALLTLEVQRRALEAGMTLRDASAYNVQFVDGRPMLIDTLSFDLAAEGEPWAAYRQFCQHFLAPLCLMRYVDLDLLQLLRVHIDGIPLPLAHKLLPRRARLRFGIATHISLHARFQQQHQDRQARSTAKMRPGALAALIDSLTRTVRSLEAPAVATEWGNYYDNTNYARDAFKAKQELVSSFLKRAKPGRVLDLGSNDGSFSRLALGLGAYVLSADVDPVAVERNYQAVKRGQETALLPLLLDLTNPSPDLGWANAERSRFSERAQADVAMALALIHHLAISNNVPLELVADYTASLAPQLIIEFVPKSDSQVQRLLATREDIFPAYTLAGFEAAFAHRYEILDKQPVAGSERVLYLMRRRGTA